ncbi:MAG: hypothetical protein RJA09_1207 [Pseudomonadota bacterium]|jgi:EmrB/QacA subfamily drug resistance transporter
MVDNPGSLQALQARYGQRYRWLLLLAVMVGAMAAIMSSTIINVAIPDMSHHFTLGQERAQWVASGFMVASTVSMLTTPWMLARFGYRRTYVWCVWALLLGGVAGGLANHYPLVLAARVLEGLAAGVVQPIPAIIILRAFEPHEQGRASGVFGMGVVLAPAIGPSIGGLLVDVFGWRSIFLMVVPFCLVSWWLAVRYVPTSAPGGAVAGQHGSAAKLDTPGLVLVGVGTAALLNGLVTLQRQGWGLATPYVVVGLLSLCGFVGWQWHLLRTRKGPPLMQLTLFQDRRFAMGCLVAFIYGAALFGSTYLFPVYMQMGLGLSASFVGTILLPAGLVLAVTIAVVGRLSDHHPTHHLVSLGLLLLAMSFALMVTVAGHGVSTTIVLLVAWAVLGRIGLGFVLPSLNTGSMRGLPKADIAQGASVINFLRMLGGAIGVSLCGIFLAWRIEAHPEDRLLAFNQTFVLLAVVCGLSLFAAWRLRDAVSDRP